MELSSYECIDPFKNLVSSSGSNINKFLYANGGEDLLSMRQQQKYESYGALCSTALSFSIRFSFNGVENKSARLAYLSKYVYNVHHMLCHELPAACRNSAFQGCT